MKDQLPANEKLSPWWRRSVLLVFVFGSRCKPETGELPGNRQNPQPHNTQGYRQSPNDPSPLDFIR